MIHKCKKTIFRNPQFILWRIATFNIFISSSGNISDDEVIVIMNTMVIASGNDY